MVLDRNLQRFLKIGNPINVNRGQAFKLHNSRPHRDHCAFVILMDVCNVASKPRRLWYRTSLYDGFQPALQLICHSAPGVLLHPFKLPLRHRRP
jgi:hypothetical protein